MHSLLVISLMLFQNAVPSSILGRAIDQSTGEPIEAVSVYLKYTMLGSATNEQGYYKIEGIEPGTYELVVSRIGYTSLSRSVTIEAKGERKEINHVLEPEVYDLEAIAVSAERPRKWSKRYEMFYRLFLGTMPFEEDAEIINPYSLDFKQQGRELRAWSEEVLVIENKALDYRIYFQLMGFVWHGQDKILEFSGTGYHEELELMHQNAQSNRSKIYSWLARSNPSKETEWKARVMKGRCKCDPAFFGVRERGSCQCSYEGLTAPSFQGKYEDP